MKHHAVKVYGVLGDRAPHIHDKHQLYVSGSFLPWKEPVVPVGLKLGCYCIIPFLALEHDRFQKVVAGD